MTNKIRVYSLFTVTECRGDGSETHEIHTSFEEVRKTIHQVACFTLDAFCEDRDMENPGFVLNQSEDVLMDFLEENGLNDINDDFDIECEEDETHIYLTSTEISVPTSEA